MSLSRYKKYKKSYQAYREANREYILELLRRWKEKHPDYAKQWREEHPDYFKEYAKKHPEIIKAIRTRKRRKWRRNNRHKTRVFNLVYNYPNRYPLDDKCAFCWTTEKLEHGHLDYEDDGQNYLTVCHVCNYWMDRAIGD